MHGEINFRVQEFIHVSKGQRPKIPVKQNIHKHLVFFCIAANLSIYEQNLYIYHNMYI